MTRCLDEMFSAEVSLYKLRGQESSGKKGRYHEVTADCFEVIFVSHSRVSSLGFPWRGRMDWCPLAQMWEMFFSRELWEVWASCMCLYVFVSFCSGLLWVLMCLKSFWTIRSQLAITSASCSIISVVKLGACPSKASMAMGPSSFCTQVNIQCPLTITKLIGWSPSPSKASCSIALLERLFYQHFPKALGGLSRLFDPPITPRKRHRCWQPWNQKEACAEQLETANAFIFSVDNSYSKRPCFGVL